MFSPSKRNIDELSWILYELHPLFRPAYTLLSQFCQYFNQFEMPLKQNHLTTVLTHESRLQLTRIASHTHPTRVYI